MTWQTVVALSIVAMAALYAVKSFIRPIRDALRPPKSGHCQGGCGCGHEDKPHHS